MSLVETCRCADRDDPCRWSRLASVPIETIHVAGRDLQVCRSRRSMSLVETCKGADRDDPCRSSKFGRVLTEMIMFIARGLEVRPKPPSHEVFDAVFAFLQSHPDVQLVEMDGFSAAPPGSASNGEPVAPTCRVRGSRAREARDRHGETSGRGLGTLLPEPRWSVRRGKRDLSPGTARRSHRLRGPGWVRRGGSAWHRAATRLRPGRLRPRRFAGRLGSVAAATVSVSSR